MVASHSQYLVKYIVGNPTHDTLGNTAIATALTREIEFSPDPALTNVGFVACNNLDISIYDHTTDLTASLNMYTRAGGGTVTYGIATTKADTTLLAMVGNTLNMHFAKINTGSVTFIGVGDVVSSTTAANYFVVNIDDTTTFVTSPVQYSFFIINASTLTSVKVDTTKLADHDLIYMKETSYIVNVGYAPGYFPRVYDLDIDFPCHENCRTCSKLGETNCRTCDATQRRTLDGTTCPLCPVGTKWVDVT